MTNKMEAETTETTEDVKSKKPRKRMKDLRKRIKSQMEFYFSDSNLQKDRFLKKETEKNDGYVDIEMFLKFNKIRSLTDSTKVISRSLKKSTLLEVNEDGSKVKRSVPLQSLADVNNRTIYVEHLPRQTDHDWVRTLFSQCGTVLYVSLPRFRSTGDLKGFGFVEFSSPDEASKACELLNNPPPMSEKTGRFPKWNKALTQLTKKTGPIEDLETEEKASDDKTKEEKAKQEPSEDPVQKPCKKHKRRRRCTSDSSQDGADTLPQKKRKLDSTDSEDPEGCKDSGKEQVTKEQGKLDESVSDGLKSEEEDRKEGKKKKKSKKRLSDANKSVEEESDQTDSSSVEKSDRKRKRASDSRDSSEFTAPQPKAPKATITMSEKTDSDKKKRKKRKKKNKEKDVPPPQLKVISKNEWLSLRTEYLSQQKANMAAMKQALKRQKEEEEAKNMEEEKKVGARPALEFIPSVIVQVQCNLSMNRKSLKEKLPSDVNIAYIDVKDEARSGHIRCKDADSAKKISDTQLDDYTFSLLTDDKEREYWDKLKSDRDTKYNTKKKPKKRGQQKLIEKAHRHNTELMEKKKHIVFED